MTGLYPDQTLIRENQIHLRENLPNVQSMSQLFRRHGYFSNADRKDLPLQHAQAFRHWWDDDPYSWDQTISPGGRDKDDEYLVATGQNGRLSWLAADGTDSEQTDGIAATEAIPLLEQYSKNKKRCFLAVGLFRPHTPYIAPKKYFDMYP